MDEEVIKYIGKIFIVVVILFGFISFFSVYDSRYPSNSTSQLKEVVTIEKMTRHDNAKKTDLEMDSANSFCKSHENLSSASNLEKSCSGLTNDTCKLVSCCVLLNGNKCVAGGKYGPTFKTETNGSKRNVDYYYYQKKCYGKGCEQK